MPANPNLYGRLWRLKAPDFEGSLDPLIAGEWLAQIQVIMNFMNVSDVDKVKYVSFVLKKEARYWLATVALRRDVEQTT